MLRLVETIGKVPENYIRNRFGLARIRYQNGWNYVMNLMRTNESINKSEDAGTAHVKIRFSDALRRVLPTRLTSYLEFRGWICQETLCDRSSATFDLRQCVGKYS